MAITDTPHTVWVAVEKKTGEIVSAFCSCFVGINSSCAHVSALLFRIEAANRLGLTNPACTSKSCSWNIPVGDKTVITPMRVKDMELKASKLNKDPVRPTLDARRTLFDPSVSKTNYSDNKRREIWYSILKETLPDSCFVLGQKALYEEETYKPVVNKGHNTVLTESEISKIEQNAIGQANNEQWHLWRKGRITASNFYRVYTRVETLKTYGGDPSKLIQYLQGESAPSENIASLKHGRNMESIAVQHFLKTFNTEHQDPQSRECGLFIDVEHQFIGASPDLLLECSCCGKGVLEVKCPSSITEKKPVPENLHYLVYNDNGDVVLKKQHQFYAQVQGQMAIAKRSWSHFFVYTQHGIHHEVIYSDHGYWKRIKENIVWFHKKYMTTSKLKRQN